MKYSTSAWTSVGVNEPLMGFLGITEQFVLTVELGINVLGNLLGAQVQRYFIASIQV